MSKKIAFSIIENAFTERNLILLSDSSEYKNAQSSLRFLCPEHIEEGEQKKSWNNFNSKGQGCKYCSKEQASNKRRKHTFEGAKEDYKQINCILITTKDEFDKCVNKDDLDIEFICEIHRDKGKQVRKWKTYIQKGACCQYCINGEITKRIKDSKFQEIELAFKHKELLLETTAITYGGAYSTLHYKCPKHIEFPQTTTWVSIQKYIDDDHYSCCRYCANEKLASERKLDINDVKLEFVERGCILLEDEFVNVNTDMNFICSKFPDKIQHTSLTSFRASECCGECKKAKLSELKRMPFNEVLNEFTISDYTLQTTEYTNGKLKLPYICNVEGHNHKTQYINLMDLKSGGGCEFCWKERVSGKNNHNYKGTTPLHDYLRKNIAPWKKYSMENCNYRCVITGDKFDIIHHLYPFHKIVSETLSELKLPLYDEIELYSNKQLKAIRDKCLEIHYKYPLGVCLTKELHNEFHAKYTNTNFTTEQFYEFQQMKIQELNTQSPQGGSNQPSIFIT